MMRTTLRERMKGMLRLLWPDGLQVRSAHHLHMTPHLRRDIGIWPEEPGQSPSRRMDGSRL